MSGLDDGFDDTVDYTGDSYSASHTGGCDEKWANWALCGLAVVLAILLAYYVFMYAGDILPNEKMCGGGCCNCKCGAENLTVTPAGLPTDAGLVAAMVGH